MVPVPTVGRITTKCAHTTEVEEEICVSLPRIMPRDVFLVADLERSTPPRHDLL